MVLGLNRDLKGSRPALVPVRAEPGRRVAAVSTVQLPRHGRPPRRHEPGPAGHHPGVMAGVGLIGAGVIFRGGEPEGVRNLTTAATVWVTAALGVACALAAWEVVLIVPPGPARPSARGRPGAFGGTPVRRGETNVADGRLQRPATRTLPAALDDLALLRLRLRQRRCLILSAAMMDTVSKTGSLAPLTRPCMALARARK